MHGIMATLSIFGVQFCAQPRVRLNRISIAARRTEKELSVIAGVLMGSLLILKGATCVGADEHRCDGELFFSADR